MPAVELRFNGSGGDVGRRVFRNRQGAVMVFVKSSDGKARTGLPTKLIGERVTKFKRLASLNQLSALRFRQAVEVGKG